MTHVALPLRCLGFLGLVLLLPYSVRADAPAPEVRLLDGLVARPIGPANMGGRIVGLAVVEAHPATMYVATASGGLWKTTNNGTTWTAVFDHEATVALGDVAVAPSNPDIVWVGTGEANARNSVAWGDGVYRSLDGGKTWKNVGLKDSHHIGRIVIHPKDPDTVYVAALGHVWGPNKERGLYKTTDGGKTWNQVKFLDEETGFIDLAMDPGDPDILYAAAYRVRRDAFSGGYPVEQFGPLAGLYKTSDGGKTWKKLSKGLPEGQIGRCGLDIYRRDPRVVYAVVQSEKTRAARETEFGQPQKPNNDAATGGVFRSDDRGETWVKLNDLCPRAFYFSQIRLDPSDERRVYVAGITLHGSRDGGKTFQNTAGTGTHADHHALWINPKDSDHLVLGNDGGLYFSFDRGLHWDHQNKMPIGQFYGVAVDMSKPYWVYGGLQDNGSWGGPSATRNVDGITASNWFRVLAMDGFHCQVDPTDANIVYAEGQYGLLTRCNVTTGEQVTIRPRPTAGQAEYRFNWSSPILLSPHDPKVVYFGGNYLFRSPNRGDRWEIISPDLTAGKPARVNDFGHTLTTIAESPLKAGILWTGSDDGRVYVSRDGGKNCSDVSANVPGVPKERHISRIEASAHAEGTAFLAIDRHRNDDRKPYLFRTTDYGKTWESLSANLPADGPVYVVRQSSKNAELLFAGTEFGLFVSLDGDGRWQPLRGTGNGTSEGLPTVAVHDLVIHPRDRELVIGTHGRSIYVMDVAPLEQLTPKALAEAAYLCDVKPVTALAMRATSGLRGGKLYAAPNPPAGAHVYYHLREGTKETVTLTITDAAGKKMTEIKGTADAGLHRIVWPLRAAGAMRVGAMVPAGEYVAKLRVGDRELTKKFRVEADE